MADPFKKVQTGDPLKIHAEAFNTFIDAAKDFKSRQHKAGAASIISHDRNGVIMVKNTSGSDQSRFAVLGLDAPVLTPTDSPQHFQNRVAMQGVTPAEGTHEGLFVVLREPLKAGAFGDAWALGVFPAQVDVQDEADGYAEIKDATTTELISGGAGSARILWKEAGTGVKWAVVRFPESTQSESSSVPTLYEAISDESGGTITARALKSDGSLIGDVITLKVLPE